MRYLFALSFIFFTGCDAQSKASFIRSQNVYPFQVVLPNELAQRLYSNPKYYVLIDLRSPELFEKARIPNAVNYPYPSTKKALQEYIISLPSNSIVLLYNETGSTSPALRRLVASQKRPTFFLGQGFQMWIGNIEGNDIENQKIENRRRYDKYYL